MQTLLWIFLTLFATSYVHRGEGGEAETSQTIPWNMEIGILNSAPSTLEPWKGKVICIVNIATGCGLSAQIGELQNLYETFRDRGFIVLAFPSNDFLNQEPGTNEEVKARCETRYHITFPLFEKIHVRGSDISPRYTWLTSTSLHGKMGGGIAWNYTKFVIDRNGRLAARYSPLTSPTNQAMRSQIERCLSETPGEISEESTSVPTQ